MADTAHNPPDRFMKPLSLIYSFLKIPSPPRKQIRLYHGINLFTQALFVIQYDIKPQQNQIKEKSMKQFSISLGFVLVLFLVITGNLYAQKGARDKSSGRPMIQCEDMFSEIDANRDGKIDMKEFEARNHPPKNAPRGRGEAKGPRSTKELFGERDKNSDGFLSLDEFCAKGDQQRNPRGNPKK
jgi:hypothetical protein